MMLRIQFHRARRAFGSIPVVGSSCSKTRTEWRINSQKNTGTGSLCLAVVLCFVRTLTIKHQSPVCGVQEQQKADWRRRRMGGGVADGYCLIPGSQDVTSNTSSRAGTLCPPGTRRSRLFLLIPVKEAGVWFTLTRNTTGGPPIRAMAVESLRMFPPL